MIRLYGWWLVSVLKYILSFYDQILQCYVGEYPFHLAFYQFPDIGLDLLKIFFQYGCVNLSNGRQ